MIKTQLIAKTLWAVLGDLQKHDQLISLTDPHEKADPMTMLLYKY